VGKLQDPQGRPYPRARVLARSVVRSHEQHSVSPDGVGFALRELGDGAYDLRAVQDGIELATAEGAHAGDEVVLDGSLAAVGPDVEVTVLDARGRPLEGAIVSGGPFASGRTDAAGRVRAANVMPGPYTLRVRAAGVRAFSREIVVPESEGTHPVSVRADAN
jgi:hypothetical protein